MCLYVYNKANSEFQSLSELVKRRGCMCVCNTQKKVAWHRSRTPIFWLCISYLLYAVFGFTLITAFIYYFNWGIIIRLHITTGLITSVVGLPVTKRWWIQFRIRYTWNSLVQFIHIFLHVLYKHTATRQLQLEPLRWLETEPHFLVSHLSTDNYHWIPLSKFWPPCCKPLFLC